MVKSKNSKKVIYLQSVDVQAINTANLYKWQSFFRFLTLIIISCFVFWTLYSVNNTISVIINDKVKSYVPYIVKSINHFILFSISSLSMYFANKRIYQVHRRFALYLIWYVIYSSFAIFLFFIPEFVYSFKIEYFENIDYPKKSNGLGTFNPTFSFLKPREIYLITQISWFNWPILALYILEFLYAIYSYMNSKYINVNEKRYWKSRIVLFTFLLIYQFIFMAYTFKPWYDIYDFFYEFIYNGTFFDGKGPSPKSHKTGFPFQWILSYEIESLVFIFIGILALLTAIIFPFIYYMYSTSSYQKEKNNHSLNRMYAIVYLMAAFIQFVLSFEKSEGWKNSINNYNYMFLGILLTIQMFLAVTFLSIDRLRNNALFRQLSLSFILFLSLTTNLIFDSFAGFESRYSAINLSFILLMIMPSLIYFIWSKKQLEKRGIINRLYLGMLMTTIMFITLIFTILPYFKKIDEAIDNKLSYDKFISDIGNFFFKTLNIWAIFYIVLALLSLITFSLILIKMLRCYEFMKFKIYKIDISQFKFKKTKLDKKKAGN